MPLRKQAGNMYPFVTHTWNPIKGRCSHDCVYCYMKRFKQNPIRLDERELKTDLGTGNFIFVGSSTDMWANDVHSEWISSVLTKCVLNRENTYLFQSKNPVGFYGRPYPQNYILGTTIETNRREYKISKAPSVDRRAVMMQGISECGIRTMVTIEPIIDFDLNELVNLINLCQPEWVNIGADSKNHHLREPRPEKIRKLIEELQKFTEIKLKTNLHRLFS